MNLSGVATWIQWLVWFFMTYLIYVINIIPVVFMLTIGSNKVPAMFEYANCEIISAVLLIYQLQMTIASFLVSSIFKCSKTAAYSGMVYFLVTNLAFFLSNKYYMDLPFYAVMILSLIGNIGVGFALRVAIYHDVKREVVNWTNVIVGPYQDQPFSIGYSMIMMSAGTVVLAVIFFYVEFILQGTLCQKTILAPAFYKRKTSRGSAWDIEGLKKKIGISLKGLRKVEGKNKVLVDNVSFNVYVGEITTIIGNHESGKGAILAMVTGLVHPTEGAILINNKDTATDALARKCIGYCPQKNIIFLNLTVAQNIKFFARMRGLAMKYVHVEIRKYCKMLNIDGNTKAKDLPNAKRRKLSLVVAFCGGTSVVVIDEPSINTDPMTKREIWDIIHKQKEGRSILISTNYMDEADILSDRLAIMFEGKLACYGTTFFLKKKYGNGYILVGLSFWLMEFKSGRDRCSNLAILHHNHIS